MKYISIASMLLLAGLLSGLLPAHEPAKSKEEPSIWMKRKLDHSKNILEGLAKGDFDKISQNAQAMKTLGNIEGFVRARTPGYRLQLEMFMDANDQIIQQASAGNLEGASLSFNQLTSSCVRCHKELRKTNP